MENPFNELMMVDARFKRGSRIVVHKAGQFYDLMVVTLQITVSLVLGLDGVDALV